MSFSSTYSKVPANTDITVHGLVGDVVVAWHTRHSLDVEVASIALQKVIAKKRRVPRRCVSLTWSKIVQNSDGLKSVSVEYVLTPLCEYETEDFGDANCFCCDDPCEDADDFPWTSRSREDNCIRCVPCYLCEECRVRIAAGWCCLYCLELSDVADPWSDEFHRLQYVLPDTVRAWRNIWNFASFAKRLSGRNKIRCRSTLQDDPDEIPAGFISIYSPRH